MIASHKSAQEVEFETMLSDSLEGMYRVALRYTRDRSLAEDLVNDSAVRALRFRDRFEPGTNFKAWIYTIVTNTFLQNYRRKKRETESFEGARRHDIERQFVSDEAREVAECPEKCFMNQLLSDDVVAALKDLPEEFRCVIVICDLQNHSYQAAAKLLRCPVGTVMSRLFRARRFLERRLAKLAIERGIRVEHSRTPATAPAAQLQLMVGPDTFEAQETAASRPRRTLRHARAS